MNIADFVNKTEIVTEDYGMDGKSHWYALQHGGVVSFEVSGVPGAMKLKTAFHCVNGIKSFRLNGSIYRCPTEFVLPVEKHQVSKSVGDFNEVLRKYNTYVEMCGVFARDPNKGELIQNAND